MLELHPMAMEDFVNRGQRPKIDEYDEQIFLVLTMPNYENGQLKIEQVSLFIGKNYLISFHTGQSDPFEPLRANKTDYLLHAIVDLITDLLENYREMAASMIDIYLSSVSHRLNDIVLVLTIISTIFIPLTFITDLYGMNFSHPTSPWSMPELYWYYGYPLGLGSLILIIICMIVYFKHKNWL